MSCAPASGILVRDVLAQTDCLVTDKVASGYAALLAPGGEVMTVLTAALVLYVAIIGYRLALGRAGFGLDELVPHFVRIGIVIALATRWPAFQTLVFNLLFDGPRQIANVILAASGSGANDVLDTVQALFDRLTDAAGDAWAQVPALHGSAANIPGDASTAASPLAAVAPGSNAVALPPGLPRAAGAAAKAAAAAPSPLGAPLFIAITLWATALVMLAASVGVLLVARILLAVLLLVAPLFIIAALFPATRGLCEGWLRTAGRFALVPLFALIGAAGMVAVLTPFAQRLADDPLTSLTDGPVLPMLVIVLVFAAVLGQSARIAGGIMAGLRLPGSRRAPATAAPGNGARGADGAAGGTGSNATERALSGRTGRSDDQAVVTTAVEPTRRLATSDSGAPAVAVAARLGHGYRRTALARATTGGRPA